MKLRTISRLIVVILVVIVGLIILVHNRLDTGQVSAAGTASAQRQTAHLTAGTPLNNKAAPAFQLADQNGTPVSLSSLQGHPVVLTFMDATCTTECPITAQYLDWTSQFLGPQATQQVEWVVMTVNPTNTPADVKTFMTKNKVSVNMHFLLGTQGQLAPLWKDYYIQVIPPKTPGGDVEHTVGTYIIDAQGHEREFLDQGYDPKVLAQDLKALLAEQK